MPTSLYHAFSVPMLQFRSLCILTIVSFVTLGCGKGTVGVIPVQGTITLDGQPVEKASIAFLPAAGQPLPAIGTTDAQGKFVMKTTEGPQELNGAMPGQYKVIINKFTQSGIIENEQGLSGVVAPGGLKVEWLIPQKYSTADTSDLTCKVETGMQELKFALKSK